MKTVFKLTNYQKGFLDGAGRLVVDDFSRHGLLRQSYILVLSEDGDTVMVYKMGQYKPGFVGNGCIAKII